MLLPTWEYYAEHSLFVWIYECLICCREQSANEISLRSELVVEARAIADLLHLDSTGPSQGASRQETFQRSFLDQGEYAQHYQLCERIIRMCFELCPQPLIMSNPDLGQTSLLQPYDGLAIRSESIGVQGVAPGPTFSRVRRPFCCG